MGWVVKLFADFFMAVGFIAVVGLVVVVVFFDGRVDSLSIGWLFVPSAIFSWVRGEFYHWPKE